MRYGKLITVMVVGIFLVGTFSITLAFAKKPVKPPSELEQRVTALEGEVSDLDARTISLENENANQNGRLDSLDSQVTDHETRMLNVENENSIQDGRLDYLEQNPSIGAALGVSDANDVFLGHLVDFRSDLTMTVFNPDIPAHFKVVTKLPPYIEPNHLGIIAFDEAGCSGQMYSGIAGERHQFSLIYDDNNDNYYVFDNAVAAINHDANDPNPTLKSCFWIDDNTCNGSCFSGLYAVLKPVTLPPEFENLAYPITVRPIQ
jgi:uncharacterized coiled-coil protein SlyX